MAVMDKDDEDAICRRTRARYSLAGFTLDELETFLQETDDEDDVQNVDDEEEYKKFLAAVLQGVEGNSTNAPDHENLDDEDEDNDADFELEIEEALESDLDENLKDDIGEGEAVEQRPKTRLSRRQNSSGELKKKASGESSRQLRPLLPYSPIASYSAFAGKGLVPRATPICLSSPNGLIYGFTPYQIGQLHSLIHEHVQLLIQTFSLCVLDPVKQYIAPDVRELISELLCKRDEMLAQGRAPYPQVCFIPKHIHSSMDGNAPDILQGRSINGLSSASDMQGDCSAALNRVQPSNCTSSSTGRLVYASTEQDGCLRSAEGSSWMPYIGDKTVTVLDVAPLKLVRKFLDDVSVAQECHRRPLGATCDVSAEKVPLFPACNTQLSAGADHPALLASPMAKKTLAASLVERAKKQSIALVPKVIATLAEQFYPLFNPVLYPHKAPPAAVVNRVLFTDAEDKLLALGLMEYNTNWKAIQQRFLPCKSKHQIFVRQKNRSSSKAPENPIKAVRRMKNSPLTAEEIVRIEEGLRVFKLDWMSVWKFIVPYRDPSILPRQWRIATGTQKSYRSNAEKKERRHLYESQKRKCKAAALENLHPSSEKLATGSDDNFGEKNSAVDCTDKDGEAYVHEAFLADSRAALPIISSEAPLPDIVDESCPHPPQVDGSQIGGKINELGNRVHLPQINRSSRTELLFMRPYRARKSNTTRMVKLSAELPPVNLPPTARVMSHSALKTNRSALAHARFSSGAKVASSTKQVISNTTESNTTNHVESEVLRERHVAEEKDCPDLQMHPLLFRAPEDCNLLHEVNSGPDANSSYTIFPGSPPQLNLSLYRHTNHAFNVLNKALKPNGKASTSSGLCFHPLLQRTADENSVAQPSASSDLPREIFTQPIVNCSEQTDLEMHSTLMPRKEKALEKSVSRSLQIISDAELMSQSTFKRPSTDIDSSAQAMVTSNETDMVNNADDILAQSLQGIVMEQEELSDSEEEEENVEFECEEMTDSEGEEEIPPSSQMTDEQIEETDRTASDEGSDEHVPPVTRVIPEEKSCSPSEVTITTQLGPGSSSPNMNSFPPVSRRANPKVTTRPKLAGSKRPGLNAEMEKPAAGNEQEEFNLGRFVSSLKNSRKRARNTGSKTNVGRPRKGIMPSLNPGMGIESSKKANEVEIS